MLGISEAGRTVESESVSFDCHPITFPLANNREAPECYVCDSNDTEPIDDPLSTRTFYDRVT